MLHIHKVIKIFTIYYKKNLKCCSDKFWEFTIGRNAETDIPDSFCVKGPTITDSANNYTFKLHKCLVAKRTLFVLCLFCFDHSLYTVDKEKIVVE